LNDNGISFNPPTLSDLMSTQYSAEMANHLEKLKLIKHSMPPNPLGLGSLNITSSKSPILSQLGARRSRQII